MEITLSAVISEVFSFYNLYSMSINTGTLVAAKAYNIKGLFNHSPAILVFS